MNCFTRVSAIVLAFCITTSASAQFYPEYFQGTSSKKIQSMRARRDFRRNQRLQQQRQIQKYIPTPQASNVIRLGKKIVSRRYSPSRVRHMTDATVVKVHDGSTFTVRLHGYKYLQLKEVRMLGVDAPEILYEECYSQESKRALEQKILNKTVHLEKDDAFLRDSYRRSLHYVRLGSRDVGAWMILNGYAESDKKVNHKKLRHYKQNELFALEEDRGIWSYKCDYDIDEDEFFDVLPTR